ncbi:MAG: flavin reductase family protein [Planctomycetes bacterium]|jgi:flavin reductase (DIM6/NTAB) family NADH-FMN oxidoreductase RutF|nr:flavin reductase family protein [Planctomycetota bacterium]
MRIEPDSLDPKDRYRLLISAIVPRPIAWVTTISPGGVVNAAPFSFFSGISSSPPMLAVFVGSRRDGTPKDTHRNAAETGEMVVNVVPRALAPAMVATSEDLPPEESEVESLGLALAPSALIRAPRLADCPVNFECRVERIIPFGGTSMLAGRILTVHVRDDLLREGAVDFAGLRPVGRLGGTDYLDPVEGVFSIPPPPVKHRSRESAS